MKNSTRKFFRSVFKVTVLSEDCPLSENVDLTALDYAITEGDCSGVVERIETAELTGEEMAAALVTQGSDPAFFGLDEEDDE